MSKYIKIYISIYAYIHFIILLFVPQDLTCIPVLVPAHAEMHFRNSTSMHYSPESLSVYIFGNNSIKRFYK